MNENKFWEIIEAALSRVMVNPDPISKEIQEKLKDGLLKLPPDEIMEFRRCFDKYVDIAATNDLWGAAYLINGGCSDDCFYYFFNPSAVTRQ